MNKKDIDYNNIMGLFDSSEKDLPLSTSICDIAEGQAKKELKIIEDVSEKIWATEWGKGIDLKAEVLAYAITFEDVAFALGYVLGQTFTIDKSEEEALETLAQIKEMIRESGFFSYLPIDPQREESILTAHKKETNAVVISSEDCSLCRFGSMCSGSALFETIPTLQTLMFDGSCPRDSESLKDLVEVSILPNSPAP